MGHVITTGGEKVWPEDLERVLTGVPGVRDVAVVGVADDEWGQRVVALVVARGSTATLHRQCRDVAVAAIGPWAAPKQLVRVSAIPRTDSGKVRRDALAALVS
jgi:acyl-coenzyme A synthetase/AMP-(fatty) acid ligase